MRPSDATSVVDRRLRLDRVKAWQLGWCGTVLAMVAGALLSVHAGRDATDDLATYHYLDSWWATTDHLRDVAPAGLNSYFNPTLDFLPDDLIRAVSPRTVAALLGAWQGLCAPVLFLIARRVSLSRTWALALAATALLTGEALSEYGTLQGDLLLAPLVLAGIWLVLKGCGATRERASWGSCLLGMAVLGAAAGLKWVVTPIAVGAFVGIVIVSSGSRDRFQRLAAGAGGALLGVVITYGWWGLILWRNFGDVLFPIFNNRFHSPYAAVAPFTGANDTTTTPWGIVSFPFSVLTNPLLTGAREGRQYAWATLECAGALLGVVAVAASVLRRRWVGLFSWPERRFLAVLFVGSYLSWIVSTGIYRYMIALEMLAYVLVAVVLSEVGRILGRVGAFTVLAAATIGVVLVTQVPPYWGRTPFTASYFTVATPAVFKHTVADFVLIDDAPNGFIIPSFPVADEFVRMTGEFPLTPKMLSLARSRLPDSVPTYVLYGDPYETGLTPAQVAGPELPQELAPLGFAVTSAPCLHFAVGYRSPTFPMYACPLAPVR